MSANKPNNKQILLMVEQREGLVVPQTESSPCNQKEKKNKIKTAQKPNFAVSLTHLLDISERVIAKLAYLVGPLF